MIDNSEGMSVTPTTLPGRNQRLPQAACSVSCEGGSDACGNGPGRLLLKGAAA